MNHENANGPNAEQIEFWNGEAGKGWAERDQQMERTLAPFAAEAIAAAQVRPGERVLDIGCGCGGSSFMLLDKVGDAGRVMGVDISEPMLQVAEQTAGQLPDNLRTAIGFERADAAVHPFETESVDLVFSRFGVMFFDDPPAAFANIRKALKPGGRLVFVCWAPVPGNQWITLPMAAALQYVPPPEPMPAHAPGPFGLADQDYVRQVLGSAGYSDISIDAYQPTMRFGHDIAPESIADFFIEAGPVSRLISESPEALTASVRDAIREAIMPFYADGTVNLGASCWIVSASA